MSLHGKLVQEGYTFDDVLLIPQKSEVLPSQVNLSTFLTNKIKLQIPISSSAMDTVTEAELAIALARLGGIGFIHKNLTIEEQAKLVKKVKLSENGMITDPVTLTKEQTLEDANHLMGYYRISGLPVIKEDGTLIGILTNRDLKYREDLSTPVIDAMTKENLITAKEGTSLEEAKAILLKHRIEKLPIVDECYKLKGLITIKDIDKAKAFPNAAKDDLGRLLCGAAVGVTEDTLVRVKALVDAGVDVITVDSAHGHSQGVINTVKIIKNNYPDLQVIGGNIVTKEAAVALIEAGADCVKVGIGPGSICTTRVVAGIGVPQITAVNDVYEVCKSLHVRVIADGGIKYSGDIVKAIAAGADLVMLGSLLAGTEEAPGEEIIYNGRRYKIYQGMGSLAAMKRGSSDRYFQGGKKEAKKLVPEGIEGRVPYKGKLEDVIYQLCGGIRAGMGYCGTGTIEDLKLNGKFIKITNAGLVESHPHDVELTAAAPNYSK
ncbi:MAG: dehydrogenase [Haloplasmataceae bacterium]|jgi:IMP dehydrogenase|nr:dehydrogenase [Haloplasmataceae bacterium]